MSMKENTVQLRKLERGCKQKNLGQKKKQKSFDNITITIQLIYFSLLPSVHNLFAAREYSQPPP